MSVVLFCGDAHGRFEHILDAAEALAPSAIVLLGDMESPRPLHVELADVADRLWLIHGNHDTDSDQS